MAIVRSHGNRLVRTLGLACAGMQRTPKQWRPMGVGGHACVAWRASASMPHMQRTPKQWRPMGVGGHACVAWRASMH
jgi:hypothetical protein